MVVNFNQLKAIYNQQINLLLSSSGLTTQCVFNFGTTKNNVCPNCIFDPNLKKSSNKYKVGGPVPFALGKICPYCSGLGFYGEIKTKTGYLAILWDYKSWINPPTNISNPEGYIQTICDKTLLTDIRNCKDITVLYNSVGSNPIFELHAEPNPGGLGDNNYLICMWKKVGMSDNIALVTPTPQPTSTPTPTSTRGFINPPVPITNTPTPNVVLTQQPIPSSTATITATPTPSLTYGATPTITPTTTPTPSLTYGATPTTTRTPTPTPSLTYGATPTMTATPSLTYGATPTSTPTVTQTATPTPSLTYGATPTATQTATPTPSLTYGSTPTVTPTSSVPPILDACFSKWSNNHNAEISFDFLAINGYSIFTNNGVVNNSELIGGGSKYVVTFISRRTLREFVIQIRNRLLSPPGLTLIGSNNIPFVAGDTISIYAPIINNNSNGWKDVSGTFTIDKIIGSNIHLACQDPDITPTPTITSTMTMTPTPSLSIGSTPTSTPTPTTSFGATPTPTNTPLPSFPLPTPTSTPTLSFGATPTSTPTPSITRTVTPTPTLSIGASSTPTPTPTPSLSLPVSPTPTQTSTSTPTPSLSIGSTPTSTPTPTPSLSLGASPTPTPTPTSSLIVTLTPTPTPSIGASSTPTLTPTLSIGASPTTTPTPTATASNPILKCDTSSSKEFYFSFGGHLYSFNDPLNLLKNFGALFFTGEPGTQITIVTKVLNTTNTYYETIGIDGYRIWMLSPTFKNSYKNSFNVSAHIGYKIVADKPISCTYMGTGYRAYEKDENKGSGKNSHALNILPKNELGNEYFVAPFVGCDYNNQGNFIDNNSKCSKISNRWTKTSSKYFSEHQPISIVATENNTEVLVSNLTNTKNYTYLLQSGESIIIADKSSTSVSNNRPVFDEGIQWDGKNGSPVSILLNFMKDEVFRILSNKKIAVFTGLVDDGPSGFYDGFKGKRSSYPSGSSIGDNYFWIQLIPTSLWTNEYLIPCSYNNNINNNILYNDTIIVLSVNTENKIYLNGNLVDTMQQYERIYLDINESTILTSTYPVLVYLIKDTSSKAYNGSLDYGVSCDQIPTANRTSDVAATIVSSTKLLSSQYKLAIPKLYNPECDDPDQDYYALIAIETAQLNTVKINNSPLSSQQLSNFSIISKYSLGWIKLNLGKNIGPSYEQNSSQIPNEVFLFTAEIPFYVCIDSYSIQDAYLLEPGLKCGVAPQVTPTPTLTATVSIGATPTATLISPTLTPSLSQGITPTPSLTIGATPTSTSIFTPTPTSTSIFTPTPSMTPEPSCARCESDPKSLNLCYGSYYGSYGTSCDACTLLVSQYHQNGDPSDSWRWPDLIYGWGDFTGYVSEENMLMLYEGNNIWSGKVKMVRKNCNCYEASLRVSCDDGYLSILEYKETCNDQIAAECSSSGGGSGDCICAYWNFNEQGCEDNVIDITGNGNFLKVPMWPTGAPCNDPNIGEVWPQTNDTSRYSQGTNNGVRYKGETQENPLPKPDCFTIQKNQGSTIFGWVKLMGPPLATGGLFVMLGGPGYEVTLTTPGDIFNPRYGLLNQLAFYFDPIPNMGLPQNFRFNAPGQIGAQANCAAIKATDPNNIDCMDLPNDIDLISSWIFFAFGCNPATNTFKVRLNNFTLSGQGNVVIPNNRMFVIGQGNSNVNFAFDNIGIAQGLLTDAALDVWYENGNGRVFDIYPGFEPGGSKCQTV